jgi:hypothetical protein
VYPSGSDLASMAASTFEANSHKPYARAHACTEPLHKAAGWHTPGPGGATEHEHAQGPLRSPSRCRACAGRCGMTCAHMKALKGVALAGLVAPRRSRSSVKMLGPATSGSSFCARGPKRAVDPDAVAHPRSMEGTHLCPCAGCALAKEPEQKDRDEEDVCRAGCVLHDFTAPSSVVCH